MTTSLHPRVTEGTVLRSALDTAGEQYRANRAAQLAVLEQLEEQLDLARAGGGPRYAAAAPRPRPAAGPGADRAAARPGLALPRAVAAGRLGHRVHRRAPASSPASAWSSGVECVIIAHDPTVRGGAMNPYTLKKTLRALEIARRQPAAGDQPGRVRRRRPAHPVGAVRARPARSSTTSPSCRRCGIPTDRAGVRQLHRRRRLRARHVRLRGAGRPAGARCSSAGRRW